MGLFSKSCSICGSSAGMLSSRKLADGTICSDCAGKLSPWFDGYRDATVPDIEAQLQYRQENRKELDAFEVTRAWGVKKYRVANQFIFDKEHRRFVVVEGPEEDFRDRNPDIIGFDQVKDVWLEVDEYWTEGKGEYDPRPINENLTQERYQEVYWRYDFYLGMETDHPYAARIRYRMNFKPTILKIPQRGIFYRRGVEIGGTYRGEDLEFLAARLEAFGEDEEKKDEIRKKIDRFLLKNRGKGTLEAVRDDLVRDAVNEVYYKKLANMGAHAARAARISRLLLD